MTLEITALPKSTTTSTFNPTGKTNTRQARCARCRRTLAKGTGAQWDWNEWACNWMYNAHPSYYCRDCNRIKTIMLNDAPRLDQALQEIHEWTRYVNLNMGWSAYEYIKSLVYRCEIHAADVAERIAVELPETDDWSYAAVCNQVAERIAREVCQEGVQDVT